VWLRGIWGTSPDNLWVVGQNGTILHSVSRGGVVEWESVPSPVDYDLYAVWGSGPTDIWAVGGPGTYQSRAGAIRYYNGPEGLKWYEVLQSCWTCPNITNEAAVLKGVWGSASNDIWAAGTRGELIHWDGTSWTRPVYDGQPFRFDEHASNVRFVFGTGPTDVWAGGAGAFAHFDGQRWRHIPEGPQRLSNLRGMSGTAGLLWIVGDEAAILRQGWVRRPWCEMLMHTVPAE